MRPRIRTIKPEIHKDEELWDLEQETGLPVFRAFVGLWSYADREGRFEWRPRALKSDILPYWDGDFSRVLDALATRGFLVRYAILGKEFGVVRTFNEHQCINGKEPASKIPPCPEELLNQQFDASVTRDERVEDAKGTARSRSSSLDQITGKVSCPAELRLTDDQATSLEVELVPRWAIEQIQVSLVANWSQDPDQPTKTVANWRKYLAGAVRGRWRDPKTRPTKPEPEEEPLDRDEVARRVAARQAVEEAADEAHRQALRERAAQAGSDPVNVHSLVKGIG